MADAALLRRDAGAFAEAIGMPLSPVQRRAVRFDKRITVVVAPRQSGKSRLLAVVALWSAFRRRKQRVLIISTGEDGSRRLLSEIRRMAASSPLLAGSVLLEQAAILRLSNGSEIRSVPASERQVRGWSVDLLLVDEAALVPDELVLSAAFPTVAARPDARIVLASSATVASGVFYDHAMRGDAGTEHVETIRWTLADAPWISPSVIEAMRSSMPEIRFRAEMENVFASGADALFTRATLERATADYRPATLGTLTGPARVLGGQDWGATEDRSACVAIARLPIPGALPVFGVALTRRWAAGEPLTDVIDELARSPAHWAALTLETNGLGMPCAQILAKRIRERPTDQGGGRRSRYVLIDDSPGARPKRPSPWTPNRAWVTRLNPVHVSAESKAATYSALRLLLDGGQLVLPASATDLLRELMLLRVDLSPSGMERIEASSGHDDLPDALALALGPYRDPSGHWRTLLAQAAQRPAPGAASAVPGGPSTVTTGAGLRVPSQPAWQSVTGRHITPPFGTRPSPPQPINPLAARARAERQSKEQLHAQ